jgi:hypothetical protein
MSIRAYRVIKKELADSSFNLWHDTDIVDFLEKDDSIMDGRTPLGIGLMDVPVVRLKELLSTYRWEAPDPRKDAIMADVAWADTNKKEYVEYECF